MADKESDEDVSALSTTRSLHVSCLDSSEGVNHPQRDPLTMKKQSVLASKLFSPSRLTQRGEERKPKSKAKGFVVHSSPLRKPTSAIQKHSSSNERRKTLQILQPAASGDGTLVGSGGVVRHEKSKKKKPSASAKQSKLKIHSTDESVSASHTESSDSEMSKKSDEVIDETVALMVSESPSERYWELLAEERRLALKDALEENERIHQELEEMKERCKKLEEVAGQAEYFASLYKMVMEGQVETSDAES